MTDITILLHSALTLMLAGMLSVFVFLSLLVWLVLMMSKLLCRSQAPLAPSTTHVEGSEQASSLRRKRVAAIAVAIQRYRQPSDN
ncbi:OadG family protein [Vibrio profundum]|uniref:OadG family protein n=1 Tax=Vibrio profundum TaxID=2910247 RepID=UPI003D11E7AE